MSQIHNLAPFPINSSQNNLCQSTLPAYEKECLETSLESIMQAQVFVHLVRATVTSYHQLGGCTNISQGGLGH